MKLPEELVRLLRQVPELARAYLVGGCVRDALLGNAHKDFDLEVYGVIRDFRSSSIRIFRRKKRPAAGTSRSTR